MKETIEEAAKNYANYNEQINKAVQEAVKFGAKWQQEQDKNKYSEQDIKSAYNEGAFAQLRYRDGKKWVDSNEWFENIKNKQQ
jgi:hypothetical protein